MALESKVDELYQLPLAEFTAARNALAKTLNGAEASRVKGLPKPTLVPWTVNQLYWRDRRTWDRLMKAGEALRDAQIAALKGRHADVRRTTDAHRAALADAVKSATTIANQAGAHPPPDQIARMLEAVSLSGERADQPGRFSSLVQPSGFEALTGLDVKGPGAAAGDASRIRVADTSSPRPEAERESRDPLTAAERRRAEAERKRDEARRAREEAERRRAAEAAVRRAEHDVALAEAALSRANRDVEEVEQALAAARSKQEAATSARDAARATLTRAREAASFAR